MSQTSYGDIIAADETSVCRIIHYFQTIVAPLIFTMYDYCRNPRHRWCRLCLGTRFLVDKYCRFTSMPVAYLYRILLLYLLTGHRFRSPRPFKIFSNYTYLLNTGKYKNYVKLFQDHGLPCQNKNSVNVI